MRRWIPLFAPWIAPDGLVSMSRDNNKSPFGEEELMTCDNDNGILYLVEMMYLYNKDFNFLEVMDATESKKYPGLYHRNPGRVDYINSHDNYTAMAAGCIYVGDKDRFKKILTHWPIFNDETPNRIKFKRGHPSGLHQPHSIFIYQLAGGNYDPNWFRLLYHVGNCLFTSLFPIVAYSHHSERCLMWLRIKSINMVVGRLSPMKAWVVKSAHGLTETIMNYKVRKYHNKLDWVIYMDWYFTTQHPIAVRARRKEHGKT